jgi:hypothetical protein
MKNMSKLLTILCGCLLTTSQIHSLEPNSTEELSFKYHLHCTQYSDMKDHVPVLRNLSKECASVVEIGIRSMVSTWGVLQGLSESSKKHRSYLGIDLNYPPLEALNKARKISEDLGIAFEFWKANDMDVEIPVCDMLFIDSLHTYYHLTYELEKFSPQVTRYIALHDTSWPWGNMDEPYTGDYSEYPEVYSRNKKGLWPAVQDFLINHPEWALLERKTNCHGFTILERI